MCRLLAWFGEPVSLEWLLWDQPHSLEHQSWQPREQRHGTINADGWGVGWYDLHLRPEPARYRTARPMWTDGSFRSVAGVVRSGRVLAAVRSATAPSITDESNSPPFTTDRWLFAHNGAVPDWSGEPGGRLRREVSERRSAAIAGSTDSEVLFALVLDRLDRGLTPAAALAEVITTVTTSAATSVATTAATTPATPGGQARLNLMLTDGTTLVATTWGDTLGWIDLDGPTGVLVASEPPDERARLGSAWHDVPDGHLLIVDAGLPDPRPRLEPLGSTGGRP